MGQPYLPTAVIAGAIIADGVLAPHRFEGIVGNAKKATVYEARPVTSAEKVDSWLRRQVAPSLAAMMVRYGGDMEYVGGLMKEGKRRFKTKHRLLADGKL